MRRPAIAALVFLAALLLAQEASAQSSGVLNQVVDQYDRASRDWLDKSAEITRTLFASLVVLELAVTLVVALLRSIGGSHGIGKLGSALLQKVIYIGLFWTFITSFPLWIPRIVGSFDYAGSVVSTTVGMQPSLILDRGVLMSSLLFVSVQRLGLFDSLASFSASLLVYLSGLTLMICYALIAARVVEALVKSYLVVSGAVWFLGFAAFRYTAPLAENYLITSVRVGVQIFVQYLLVAVLQSITLVWIEDLQGYSPQEGFALPMSILGGAIVAAWIVFKVPSDLAYSLTAPNGFLRLREALTADV